MLETDNSTPYYLNLHNGEVAHTLILGMTGSGKSYLCNFLLQNAQKYHPLTFIFDIGGSFQSLTTIFGGSYLNVGRESRDFTINPFSLPRTKENLQFLFSFFRVLIEGNDARYRLDFREERKLWDGIERVYVLEPEQRTISNFANIIGELKDRLHRWTRQGSTDSSSTTPKTRSRSAGFRPSISPAGEMRPKFWNRCCSTSCTGRATRSPIQPSSVPSRPS